MIKKNLWFLTLFSLILVLSIYYVTMPNDLLSATGAINTNEINEEVDMEVKNSNIIAALKVEDDSKVYDTLNELESKLNTEGISIEEKNSVYEQIKTINTNSGIEESIESKVKENYNCSTFAKIDNTSVKVVVDECENSKSLANNIMRLVQEQFDNKMYISVQFES